MLHRQYLKAAIKAGLPIVALSLAGKNSLKNKPVYENSLGKDILYTARAAMDGLGAGLEEIENMFSWLDNKETYKKLEKVTGIPDWEHMHRDIYENSMSHIERKPLRKVAELGYYVPEIALLQGRARAGVTPKGKLLSKESAARMGLYAIKRWDENMQSGMDFEPALVNAVGKAMAGTVLSGGAKHFNTPFNVVKSAGLGAVNSVVNNLADKYTGKEKDMKWISGDKKKPAVFNLPQMRDGAIQNITKDAVTNNLKGSGKGRGNSNKSGKNKTTLQRGRTNAVKTKQGVGKELNAAYKKILKRQYEQNIRNKNHH